LYVKNYESSDKFSFNPIAYIIYLVVFLKNLVLSNWDVARRVIDPKLPINPGIVEIKTNLKFGGFLACFWTKNLFGI